MAGNDYSMIAMILAIVSAISFVIAGVLVLMLASSANAALGPYAGMAAGVLMVAGIISIVSGIVVLIGGILIRNPSKRMIGSILALVFGIIGIFGGGGFILTGTILAIVAGILGLVSKPQ